MIVLSNLTAVAEQGTVSEPIAQHHIVGEQLADGRHRFMRMSPDGLRLVSDRAEVFIPAAELWRLQEQATAR